MEVIKLNLIPAGALPVVHASQYDDGREFKAELYEGVNVYTLDGTETLTAIVKKPDGNEVTAAVSNTSDNYVIITTTEQMTACAGGNLGTLRIEKGAVTIATLNFILECQASPDTGIQSDSEIHNLEEQVNQMVDDAVATQYDSANVIFDNLPTAGHGIPYTVTSEGIGNAIDAALEMTADASGAIATFESDYALPLRDLEIEINAVETGDGNPKGPNNPYTLSGFTGANITRFGKNYLALPTNPTIVGNYTLTETANGITISGTDTVSRSTRLYYGYLPAETYTIFDSVLGSNTTHQLVLLVNGSVKAYITTSKYTYTVSSTDFVEIRLYIYPANTDTLLKPQLEIGSTATTYEAHTETVYPVSWNDEAGTVYGAKSKPIVGGLTVTHGFIEFDGSSDETFQYNSAYDGFRIKIDDAGILGKPNEDLLSNIFVGANIRGALATPNFTMCTYSGTTADDGKYIFFCGTGMTDVATFKTWLSSNHTQVVYPLAVPVQHQLAPTGNITAIVGTNNIFTDTNGDTSLEYYSGNGAETAQVAEEIAGVVVADYAAKAVKTKNGTFTNLLASPLNSVWLVCCQKITAAGSGFVGIYSFDGVNLNPCIVYIDDMSASFDSATGTLTVKYGGSTTDVYGSAFRLA